MPRHLLSRLTRSSSYVAYYLVASHLPRTYAPGGAISRTIRAALVRRMVDQAGNDITVESGAHFGSGKGIVIGDRSGLGVRAEILGPLVLGTDVMMGPGCTFISTNHRFDDPDRPMNSQGGLDDIRPVVVEDDVWLGANVTVTAGVRIGTGSVIAAGAVVTRDIPPFSIAAGVPARVLRSRRPDPAVMSPPLSDAAPAAAGSLEMS
ncbi:2,3,4,5-tetrahydropyridine-2,6-dicarboxylate N-acetyltransferase [Austwickia sp. TVS 96-490-7B]|uniref:acyltransferase n=1 Tax=Austwickia sp. TVS 96-490-7B TaxID=2830843 RepID=UPI001C57665A|nr:acyltransferase [Austwickia sp. TVS 96-490-7B]MBW3084578.1 2,3,4,5-tetrahydropyridine-2,6-dicarboxylate N-acetyltransferase [Austwickia sp. TVS 96-490-7B]